MLTPFNIENFLTIGENKLKIYGKNYKTFYGANFLAIFKVFQLLTKSAKI